MIIEDISELFEQKFEKCSSIWANKKNIVYCKDSITELSKDDSDKNNPKFLCKYKNKFFGFDYIAKEYGITEPSTDMIFFDIEKEYIVFVEYKNGQIKGKKDIQHKFLNSFSLLNQILNIDKKTFWSLKTYLIFITNRKNNKGQEKYIENYQQGSYKILGQMKQNIILYNFQKYKPWYFNEIKTPFCDEFENLMKQEFNIILEKEELI